MTDALAAYAAKCATPAEAAAPIADRSNLILGMGAAMPPAFMAALADRARSGDGLSRLPI